MNGTFFAAISLRTRSREIMLPLLLFPFSIPAIAGNGERTTAILTGEVFREILDRSACWPMMSCSLPPVCFFLSWCSKPNETRHFPFSPLSLPAAQLSRFMRR